MFFGLGDRLKLTEIAPASLLLENRRTAALFDVLVKVFFIGVWYYFFGRGAVSLNDWIERVRAAVMHDFIVILFLMAPLTFMPDIVRKLRVIFKGSRVFFDGMERRINLNDQEIARFKDVACVRVSKFRGSRGSTSGLWIVHRS